jgi:putative ABC transport system ATP-binding protein
MVGNPALLLADEPTGALDTKSGQQIMDIFRQLSENGMTIIMITHELSIAQCADKIYHILDGELQTEDVRITAAGSLSDAPRGGADHEG